MYVRHDEYAPAAVCADWTREVLDGLARRVLASIDAGFLPWWAARRMGVRTVPCNPILGVDYSGLHRLLLDVELGIAGHPSPVFLSEVCAVAHGLVLRTPAHGVEIIVSHDFPFSGTTPIVFRRGTHAFYVVHIDATEGVAITEDGRKLPLDKGKIMVLDGGHERPARTEDGDSWPVPILLHPSASFSGWERLPPEQTKPPAPHTNPTELLTSLIHRGLKVIVQPRIQGQPLVTYQPNDCAIAVAEGVDDRADPTVRIAFYRVIAEHLMRTAGLTPPELADATVLGAMRQLTIDLAAAWLASACADDGDSRALGEMADAAATFFRLAPELAPTVADLATRIVAHAFSQPHQPNP